MEGEGTSAQRWATGSRGGSGVGRGAGEEGEEEVDEGEEGDEGADCGEDYAGVEDVCGRTRKCMSGRRGGKDEPLSSMVIVAFNAAAALSTFVCS